MVHSTLRKHRCPQATSAVAGCGGFWRLDRFHRLPPNRDTRAESLGVGSLMGLFFAVLVSVSIYVILAVSYDLVLGYGGLFSIAHAAFFATGAYGMAVSYTHLRAHETGRNI